MDAANRTRAAMTCFILLRGIESDSKNGGRIESGLLFE